MAKKPKKKKRQAKPKGKGTSAKKQRSTKKATTKKATNNKPSSRKGKKLNRKKGLGLYIRVKSLIWKVHKGEYASGEYRQKGSKFLQNVRKVYNECKQVGADCTNGEILDKYQQIVSGEKRPEPFISADLYEDTHPYWELKDVEFAVFAPYLWIVSPMLIAPPSEFEISEYASPDGDTTEGYNRYFKEWVDWCNMVYRDQHGMDFGSEVVEIHFVFTKPTWNEQKKRWETEILSVTPQGVIEDFGYVPKGAGEAHNPDEHKEHTPKKGEQPATTQPETPVPTAKSEAVKTAKLDRLLKTKKSIMDEVKLYADIGEEKEKKSAIERLKKINKQIDALNE